MVVGAGGRVGVRGSHRRVSGLLGGGRGREPEMVKMSLCARRRRAEDTWAKSCEGVGIDEVRDGVGSMIVGMYGCAVMQ